MKLLVTLLFSFSLLSFAEEKKYEQALPERALKQAKSKPWKEAVIFKKRSEVITLVRSVLAHSRGYVFVKDKKNTEPNEKRAYDFPLNVKLTDRPYSFNEAGRRVFLSFINNEIISIRSTGRGHAHPFVYGHIREGLQRYHKENGKDFRFEHKDTIKWNEPEKIISEIFKIVK